MFRFAPSKEDALKSEDSSSNNNNSNNHKNNSDEESLQNLQREWAMLSAEDPLWWTHQQQQEQQQQQQQLQQREHVRVQQQWWYYSRQRHPLLSNRGWKGGRRNGGNSNHNNEDDDVCWWLTQQGQNADGDQQQQQQPWYLLCGGQNDYDDDAAAAAAAERSRLDACADSFMRCLLWMGVVVDLIACAVALTWGLYCWIVESVRFESREARNVGILLVVQSCIFLLRCLMVRALLRIPIPSEYSDNNNYNNSNNSNKKGDDAAIMSVGSDTIRGDDDDVTDHCACLCMKPFLYASFFISFFMSVLYICFGLWWFDFGGYDSETSLLRTDWMYDAAEHILRESLLQFLGQRTVVFVLVLTASISELVRLFLLRLFLNELELNMILLRHHGTSTKKHGSGETTIVFEDASWFELEPDNISQNDDTVSDLSRGLLSASWMDEEASYYHQRVASPPPPARATTTITTTTRNRATTTPTSTSAQGVQGDLYPTKETGLEWGSASGDK